MLLSATALVRVQSSGSSFCHHNACRDETQEVKGDDGKLTVNINTHHGSVLQLVVGVGYDGLRAAVQQLLDAALVLPPSGGTEEVQAEAPQCFLGQTFQQRRYGVHGQRRPT